MLVQIRAGMLAGEARLDLSSNKEYTEAEAMKSFRRIAEAHGWEPKADNSQKKS